MSAPLSGNLGGYEPTDLMGKRIQEFIYAEDTVSFERSLELARRGVAGPFEFRLLTLRSSIIWVEVSGKNPDR